MAIYSIAFMLLEKGVKMVKLDSINLLLHDTSCIYNLDKSLFTLQKSSKNDTVISNKAIYAGKDIGLHRIDIDNLYHAIKIQLSSKILKENYFDLININTIENVVDNINLNPAIQFDKNKFIENALLLKADVTDNLPVKDSISRYIESLYFYRLNHKYKIDSYKDESIIFKRDVKSYKERIIFYDKMTEIQKDKNLMDVLLRKKKLKLFQNILRCESNIVSFKSLRDSFGIVNCNYEQPTINNQSRKYVSLIDVLKSERNVNLKLLDEITTYNMPQLLFEYENTDIDFYRIEKIEGRKRIIELCNYDINIVMEFVKSKMKGRLTNPKYRKEYKELISSMLQKKGIDLKKESEYITEIKELLKAS